MRKDGKLVFYVWRGLGAGIFRIPSTALYLVRLALERAEQAHKTRVKGPLSIADV